MKVHNIGNGQIIKGDCLDVMQTIPDDFVILVAEYVFVFQKPAESKSHNNIYHFRTTSEKEENKLDISDYQGEITKNVWKIPSVAHQQNFHPCPFPL